MRRSKIKTARRSVYESGTFLYSHNSTSCILQFIIVLNCLSQPVILVSFNSKNVLHSLRLVLLYFERFTTLPNPYFLC